MYTERDKVRYVEMMWAEGLTPLAAQRKWGRPSRGLLRKWELLAEAGELPAERPRNHGAVERPKHARYPEATRKEAVRLHKLGEKRMHIARRLGIADASVISVWVDNERKRAIMSETGDLCQDFGHFCLRFYAAKGSTSQAFKVLSKNASITSAGTR